MSARAFKARLGAPRTLAGTFMKTPAIDVLEVLILAGLDFVVLDAEHAPFDRSAISACCAVARARDVPLLVRPAAATPEAVLSALDAGATGILAPHVVDAEGAAQLARSARFGPGGRGFAGSSRWAGYGTQSMGDLLDRSAAETVVIAQIEDAEAVAAAGAIAATDGIDGLFLGPADLSVAYGQRDQSSDALARAMAQVGAAAREAGVAYWTWVPGADRAAEIAGHGFTGYCIASDHAWMLAGARAAAAALRDG